jgi:hypothetical protein
MIIRTMDISSWLVFSRQVFPATAERHAIQWAFLG